MILCLILVAFLLISEHVSFELSKFVGYYPRLGEEAKIKRIHLLHLLQAESQVVLLRNADHGRKVIDLLVAAKLGQLVICNGCIVPNHISLGLTGRRVPTLSVLHAIHHHLFALLLVCTTSRLPLGRTSLHHLAQLLITLIL